MQNMFLTEYFDWQPKRPNIAHRIANKILRELKISYRVGPYSGNMTSVEQRMNIFHFVMQSLVFEVPGDVVEVGCYSGQVAILLQKLLQQYAPERQLHVYDSFEGLPDKSVEDGATPFKKGFLTTTEAALRENFRRYALPEPVVHKGWFEDTLPEGLPDKISFAHLDGDFYSSIKVSLKHVYPRLSEKAVCVIDDHCDPRADPRSWNHLPGVKRACDEFFRDKPEEVHHIYSGPYPHGYFRKV